MNNNKICILVGNDVTSDPRVTKEAKTLTDAGYKVTAFGIKSGRQKTEERKNGYKVIRLPRKIKPKRKEALIKKSYSAVSGVSATEGQSETIRNSTRERSRFNLFSARSFDTGL